MLYYAINTLDGIHRAFRNILNIKSVPFIFVEGPTNAPALRETRTEPHSVSPSLVMFKAYRTTKYVPSSQPSKIPYEYLDHNVGEGFNQATSDFAAPVPGIYLFTLTFRSVSYDNYVECDIIRNGEVEARGSSLRPGTATLTTTMVLSKGDRVWTEVSWGNGDLYSTDTKQTQFNGILISAMTP